MPQFTTRRRVRHSAADMFDLVADVESYPEFVPLCKDLKIRQRFRHRPHLTPALSPPLRGAERENNSARLA